MEQKSNNKPCRKSDYHKQLEAIISSIKDYNTKPTLLLHACCAPCSSYVIEYLAKFFDITIYYYNPNIHPETEYTRRMTELVNFLPRFPDAVANQVKLVQAEYNVEDYFKATKVKEEAELQKEEERGERCRRCYELRLTKAREYAAAHGFDWFTTTLSISPYKDAEKINTIGLSFDNSGKTKYLPADFKKNSGFLRSTQISREYDLWRQDYCGCIYSKQNEEARRAASLEAKSNTETPAQKKHITVSAAIITRTDEKTGKTEFFATQRGYGNYKDYWEFPGGKIEQNETPEQCIVREIREELATEIKPESHLITVDYEYPEFFLTMHCFICSIINGSLKLLEHEDAKWITAEEIQSLHWLPADDLVFPKLISYIKQTNDC